MGAKQLYQEPLGARGLVTGGEVQSSERLAYVDREAAIRGVYRTEFVLRSSEAAAIEILNERPVITLDDEAWDDFVAALDAPVELDPSVKERFARRPQWDG